MSLRRLASRLADQAAATYYNALATVESWAPQEPEVLVEAPAVPVATTPQTRSAIALECWECGADTTDEGTVMCAPCRERWRAARCKGVAVPSNGTEQKEKT